MWSAMVRHAGHGLSAVQLGVPIRMVVLLREDDAHQTHQQILVDPSIKARSPGRIGSWERCLSVPWGYRYTERTSEVTVHFRDLAGHWHDERISGGAAVVLQHELDHLDGALLSDGLDWQDFVPERDIAMLAASAQRECRKAGAMNCNPFRQCAWMAWRSDPNHSASTH
jgi:peptide deformylase